MAIEYRAVNKFSADEEGKLSGQAIVFGQESVDFGGWTEIIEAGAISFVDDVVLDFDHKSEYILARQANKTLDISQDSGGVNFEAVPPKTSWVEDLRVSMKGGYIEGCSFAFECLRSEWVEVAGKVIRIIKEALVYNLTITGSPAYPQTSSEARSQFEALKNAPKPQIKTGDAETTIEESGTEARSAEGGERSDPHPEYVYTKKFGIVKLLGKE
ncbi:MAG: hypothetical protein HGA54_01665 [Actinobacteria bacterium]|nr:hypothetical protein [Actinomycetota bacterium]